MRKRWRTAIAAAERANENAVPTAFLISSFRIMSGITPRQKKSRRSAAATCPMAFDSAMVVTVSESAAKNKSDDRIPVIMPAAAAYIGYFSLPQE